MLLNKSAKKKQIKGIKRKIDYQLVYKYANYFLFK